LAENIPKNKHFFLDFQVKLIFKSYQASIKAWEMYAINSEIFSPWALKALIQ